MSMYWIIFIGFALLSWLVSSRLQNKFEKYSKIPMPNGMTGKDVAEKMLHDNGIYDVKVISTPGHLTDHYNPANQTVNLSESVYYSNSIAAAAVAAGHGLHALHFLKSGGNAPKTATCKICHFHQTHLLAISQYNTRSSVRQGYFHKGAIVFQIPPVFSLHLLLLVI